jgi:hypothetical protein
MLDFRRPTPDRLRDEALAIEAAWPGSRVGRSQRGSLLEVRRLCLLVVLSALVGCGSAQSKQFTEFVARAAKLCPEATAGFSGRAESDNPVAIKELRALVRANESLPVVRSFRAYAKERNRLRAAEPAIQSAPSPSVAAEDRARRRELFGRQLKIYQAERRLPGIGSCALSPRTKL